MQMEDRVTSLILNKTLFFERKNNSTAKPKLILHVLQSSIQWKLKINWLTSFIKIEVNKWVIFVLPGMLFVTTTFFVSYKMFFYATFTSKLLLDVQKWDPANVPRCNCTTVHIVKSLVHTAISLNMQRIWMCIYSTFHYACRFHYKYNTFYCT